MEKNIKTTYHIPDLESGYSYSCTKEEYDNFMNMWEACLPKFHEKWGNDFAKPMIHSYIPMPEIDGDFKSIFMNPEFYIMDLSDE